MDYKSQKLVAKFIQAKFSSSDIQKLFGHFGKIVSYAENLQPDGTKRVYITYKTHEMQQEAISKEDWFFVEGVQWKLFSRPMNSKEIIRFNEIDKVAEDKLMTLFNLLGKVSHIQNVSKSSVVVTYFWLSRQGAYSVKEGKIMLGQATVAVTNE